MLQATILSSRLLRILSRMTRPLPFLLLLFAATALLAATQWHYASHKSRPRAGKFREIANAEGFKAALQWRDGAFKEIDAPRASKP